MFSKEDRQSIIESIVDDLHTANQPVDSRKDATVNQTDESSEITMVAANIRARSGDVRSIQNGILDVVVKSKIALFDITDYLDDDDTVYSYEVEVLTTDINGVNRVDDEVEIEFVRDDANVQFIITIAIDPQYVQFDSTWVDLDQLIGDPDEDDDSMYAMSDKESYIDISESVDFQTDSRVFVSPVPNTNRAILTIVPKSIDNGEEYFDAIAQDLENLKTGLKNKVFFDVGYNFLVPGINFKGELVKMSQTGKDIASFEFELAKDDETPSSLMEFLNIDNSIVSYPETLDEQVINEIRRRIKVNSRGVKRIKMQCRQGFKFDAARRVCVKISGNDMMQMRRSHIKASRTKKAAGTGFKLRVLKKTKKANRFRKMLGLRSGK